MEDSNGGLEIKDIQQGDALSSNVIHGRIKSLINTNNYWQKEFFNTRPNLRRENMILVAPTGFGKTEFAYLWGAGINNLMLLPMRAATNKLFDRTQNLYGKDQVALLHGDASLELLSGVSKIMLRRPRANVAKQLIWLAIWPSRILLPPPTRSLQAH